MTDIVGMWDVPLSDGVHKVVFEHGTVSGKRVITLDNQEVYRIDWMFSLTGEERFKIGNTPCCIRIEPTDSFAFEYTLTVNGKSLKKFTEAQSKLLQCWIVDIDGTPVRVAMEKNTLDIYANGRKVEVISEFTDFGTETHFSLEGHNCFIRNCSSGRRVHGILHVLFVDGKQVADAKVTQY